MRVWTRINIPGVDYPLYRVGGKVSVTLEELLESLEKTTRREGYEEGSVRLSLTLGNAAQLFDGLEVVFED